MVRERLPASVHNDVDQEQLNSSENGSFLSGGDGSSDIYRGLELQEHTNGVVNKIQFTWKIIIWNIVPGDLTDCPHLDPRVGVLTRV